jgi:hypothetical protein
MGGAGGAKGGNTGGNSGSAIFISLLWLWPALLAFLFYFYFGAIMVQK